MSSCHIHNISHDTTKDVVSNSSSGFFTFTACFKVVIFSVQFVGNILVIWTVFATPSLRSTCMIFICNLAIADFLTGILAVPVSIAFDLHMVHQVFQTFVFHASLVLAYTLCSASLLNLVVLSIDRCMAIVEPMKYKVFMTTAKIKITLFAVWSLAILAGFIEGFDILPRKACFLVSISLIVSFYLAITISYGILFRKVKLQNQVRAQMMASTATDQLQSVAQRNRDKNLAKTVGLVIGVFTMSWSLIVYTMQNPPYQIQYPIFKETWGRLFEVGSCLAFSSAAANPLIYFFRTSSMKNAAKALLYKTFSLNR